MLFNVSTVEQSSQEEYHFIQEIDLLVNDITKRIVLKADIYGPRHLMTHYCLDYE